MKRFLQMSGMITLAGLLAAESNAATVTWSGGDFDWDQPDNDSFSGTYNSGDDVVFNGAGTGTDITVVAGGVTPGNFALSAGTYRFIGGNINAGSFTISGGTLQYTNSAQLGSGTIYVTGNGTLESVRGSEPTILTNAIVVSDGVMVTFKQRNPNNIDTAGPTVGAISGGSTSSPIDVNLIASTTLQRWQLSPSTFIGNVNITGSRLYLENFLTSHFGHVSNTVNITAGGFQADGTVQQKIVVAWAALGGGFFDKLIVNGELTQTGTTLVPGELRLNNSASTFETLQLQDTTLELSYLPASGFVRNGGGSDSTLRFLGNLVGSTGVNLRNVADSTFYVDVPSNTASVTVSGSVLSTASTRPWAKSGAGQLNLDGGGNLFGSTFAVNAGTLNVNSSILNVGEMTVASGATLGGSGTIGGKLSGSGLVSPGNSPGILTAVQADPSGGLDFGFELTQTGNPTWSNASASGNDVQRLTDASAPFTASLSLANELNIYFHVASLTGGDIFRGGFFTDRDSDFTALVSGATYNYFVLGDGLGSDATFNGTNYYTLANYEPGASVIASVVQPGAANFSDGTVTDGWVQQFEFVAAIPEPSAVALLGLGLLALLRRVGGRSLQA